MRPPASASPTPRRIDMLVDGHAVVVVEISVTHARVVSEGALKPDQRVRVTLRAHDQVVRVAARVLSAQFEMPKEGPRYRGELSFEGDTGALVALLG